MKEHIWEFHRGESVPVADYDKFKAGEVFLKYTPAIFRVCKICGMKTGFMMGSELMSCEEYTMHKAMK